MRRNRFGTCIAVAVAMVTGALAPGSAQGTPPSHFSSRVDFSFPLAYYTSLCGFPVYQSLTGRINTTLRYDRAGRIVSEVDTQPGATLTLSSPTTGRSFSFPFAAIAHIDYTNGAALGSRATSSGGGLFFRVPGLPPDAGRVVFDGVVVATTPEGIPIVAFTGVISTSGRFGDPAAIDAAICRALAP